MTIDDHRSPHTYTYLHQCLMLGLLPTGGILPEGEFRVAAIGDFKSLGIGDGDLMVHMWLLTQAESLGKKLGKGEKRGS